MPFTFGHFRPLIFLPAEAAAWPAARRRHVVLHELAHIRRHDYAAHLFARCVLAFYWWHPLAWYAWRHLAAERELAADDSVLRRGVRPSDYAESLLCVAAALPPARFALGMARRVPLEGRLRSILAVKTVRTAPGRLATAAAALACVVAVLPIATLRGQNQNPAALTQGLDALQRKEYEEAFSRFAGLDPAGAALWQALTRERQGRAAEAAERFDRAVALAMGDDKAESVALRLYDRFLAADAARPGARQAVQARLAELEARHRAALARQTPGAEVRRVGGGVIAPRLLEKVQPLYSQEARGAKLEGTVVLSVEIDAAGRPGNIRILRGVGLGLDENAREALARWRFEPGRAEGRAVPVAATVEVNFKLLD
jgi:TonB family protein